jgi:hypothetical protein
LCAESALWLGAIVEDGAVNAGQKVIGETVRIGITRAADHVLRFYEAGNPFVSGPKRLLAAGAFGSSKKNGSGMKKKEKAKSHAKTSRMQKHGRALE